ncbi:RibD family protein [Nonomuraea sp. NPDC049480]|uniref:RibD family protein n=1 Tax=Nonomuraea sp. NPDC049480 TaxID=3364353 RepID=UPI003788002E
MGKPTLTLSQIVPVLPDSGRSRPYVVASCAMSLDGYLDDATAHRLILSNPEDFDRVDALRAWADAILVGAGTLRADNPRLKVRSAERRARRVRAQRPATPLRVVISAAGNLDPTMAFFDHGAGSCRVRRASSAPGASSMTPSIPCAWPRPMRSAT